MWIALRALAALRPMGNTALRAKTPQATISDGAHAPGRRVVKGLAPLWARFKQRPDWFKAVAAVVVASAAVFAGVGAANALAPKVEEPTPSAERSSAAAGSFEVDEAAGAEIAEDAEVAENPGAAQAADSGADAERPDPRVVADTALAALDAASFAEGVVCSIP